MRPGNMRIETIPFMGIGTMHRNRSIVRPGNRRNNRVGITDTLNRNLTNNRISGLRTMYRQQIRQPAVLPEVQIAL